MSGDTSLFDVIFEGAVTAAGALFAWAANSMRDDIKKNDMSIRTVDKGLSDFQLYVSNNYPKETTMARLYATLEKMDDKLEKMDDKLASMGNDTSAMKAQLARKVH